MFDQRDLPVEIEVVEACVADLSKEGAPLEGPPPPSPPPPAPPPPTEAPEAAEWVSETQTSPTASLWQGSPYRWSVLSGVTADHPWPNTKNGCSNVASTVTCEQQRQQQPQSFSGD